MMRNLTFTLVAAGVAACQPVQDEPAPTVDQAAELEALKQVSARWSEVSGTGNIEAELSFWADDAVFMPPGTDFLDGKGAIRAFLEQESTLENFSIEWKTRGGYVAKSGELAYLVEALLIEFDDEAGNRLSAPGKVVTVCSSAGLW